MVPQWRSRGKFIDLVVTDRAGRRLAIEADGEQHHETVDGKLIPEDVYRQELLEEVGWVFHRVRFTEFTRDPERHVDDIRRVLGARPANEQLAAEAWGEDAISLYELEQLVAPSEVETVDTTPSAPAGPLAVLEAPITEQEGAALSDEDLQRLQADARPEPQPGDQQAFPLGTAGAADDALDQVDDDEAPLVRDVEAGVADEEDFAEYSEPEPLELNPGAYDGTHLHDVPLALLPQQIAMVVAERGAVDDEQIADAYAARFGIDVPRNRRRLLTSFAWSAGGRKFIRKDGDRWIPATVAPHPIEHLGSWTLTQVEQLVRELVDGGVHEDDLFEQVLAIVWTSEHRVPRPVTKAVGAAIYAVVGKRV